MSHSEIRKEEGRIQTASTRLAYCEVSEDLAEGDVLEFDVDGERVRARIAYLQTGLGGKNVAHAEFLDSVPKVPKRGTPVYRARSSGGAGMDFTLGHDASKRPVTFRLNTLFRHTLLAGMTQQGKTHLQFAVLEQLLQWQVPAVVVDSQGEFKSLPEMSKRAVVTQEWEEVVPAVRQRKVAVLDVVDDAAGVRKGKMAQALTELFETQERASADKAPHPPTLVFVDEGDRFAPASRRESDESTNALIEVAKRGSKLGLGLVLATQRPGAVHLDVRSQLNGGFYFKLTDNTSRVAMRDFGLTRYDVELVSRLAVGECLVAGSIVPSPTRMRVRKIQTPRTRSVDFESMLTPADA